MTCYSKPPLSTDLPADVLERVSVWRPPVWDETPHKIESLALPMVRCWVAAARPNNVPMVRRMMRATSEFAMWMHDTSGVVDVRLFCPANVEHWSSVLNDHRSGAWRHSTKWVLRRVGRAAFPDGWYPAPLPTGKNPPACPYTVGEETAFRLSAGMPNRVNPGGRRWVVAATLGAGLLSPVIASAVTDDVVTLGGGRLGVRVRGRHPRVVPIRAAYTPLLAEAMEMVGDGRFVTAVHRTAVYMLCRQVALGDQVLSVRRARSTWLVAHLHAATPLSVLRHIAGPLSGDTLTALLASSAADLDPTEAAIRGLGA